MQTLSVKKTRKRNGLTTSAKTSNNGDDFFSRNFYYEVLEAFDRFWANTQVSHFVDGVPVRTSIPRKKPKHLQVFNNEFEK